MGAPEGSTTVIRCRYCGGRDEHLTEELMQASDVDRMRDAAVLATRVADFAAHHARCHTSRRNHPADDAVADAVETLTGRYADIIQRGGFVLPMLHVVARYAGRLVFYFPALDCPLSPTLFSPQSRT